MLSTIGAPAIRMTAMGMSSANIAIGGGDCEQLVNLCALYGLSYAVGSAVDTRLFEKL
jgi:hypothetical protein